MYKKNDLKSENLESNDKNFVLSKVIFIFMINF